jgi:hypothetical protein
MQGDVRVFDVFKAAVMRFHVAQFSDFRFDIFEHPIRGFSNIPQVALIKNMLFLNPSFSNF